MLWLTATYYDSTCGLHSFAMLNAKYAESPMLSGKQSLSDSQQWVFTLTIVGLPLARTLRPSAARPRLPILFFSPQLHPQTLHQSPVMAAPRFLSARVYTSAHTRSRRSIYIHVYRIYSLSGIYSSNSKSIFPSGRKGSRERPYITAFFPCIPSVHRGFT